MFVSPEQIGLAPVQLMIVGESPATEEVKQGKPFVGYSGNILRGMLERHKLRKRGITVYITNAVKIANFDSDGNNVNPTNDDIDKWRHLIHREIVTYNPKIVLMLGVSAAYSVTGLSPTIATSTNPFNPYWRVSYEGFTSEPELYLTYHPSSLWRKEFYEGRWAETWDELVAVLTDKSEKPWFKETEELENWFHERSEHE